MKNEKQFNSPAREPVNYGSAILNNLYNKIPKQQQGYSEEEVLGLLQSRDRHTVNNLPIGKWLKPKEWFEKFKKK